MPGILTTVLVESFNLFALMAPYLLLGIVVAGIMHVVLPVDFVSRRLGRKSIGAVFKAGALGVPIPLCSCGVVPVAASLSKNGASKGATVSFLVTTPTSGVDSMFATYSLLGWPLMVLRVVASFILGIVAGALTNIADTEAPAPKKAGVDTVSKGGHAVTRALTYAFTELYGGISRPLLVGSLLGGVITALLPPDLLSETVGTGILSYLVMLAVGIPLYVCASGSIPFAAALLAKGISPGAALIFLIVGPATNAATVTVVSQMLGKKTLMIYLAVLTVGTLFMGATTDWLFTAVPLPLPLTGHIHNHGGEGPGWIEIVSATGLLALSLYYLVLPLIRKMRGPKKGDQMIELTVNDMTCGHCAKTIENAVCDLQGVKSVHANPDSKKVLIDANEDLKQTLKDVISKAGYTPE
ncbi:MAG: permease [Deltaproteobacteria bacterium]|nr:permease [Deltaproteobacteria bacterium]